MDFSLSNEQRSWQMTARKFADEEIKPITLDLDEAPDAHGTFDWDIIEKGSKLGFRTLAVPKVSVAMLPPFTSEPAPV